MRNCERVYLIAVFALFSTHLGCSTMVKSGDPQEQTQYVYNGINGSQLTNAPNILNYAQTRKLNAKIFLECQFSVLVEEPDVKAPKLDRDRSKYENEQCEQSMRKMLHEKNATILPERSPNAEYWVVRGEKNLKATDVSGAGWFPSGETSRVWLTLSRFAPSGSKQPGLSPDQPNFHKLVSGESLYRRGIWPIRTDEIPTNDNLFEILAKALIQATIAAPDSGAAQK